MSYSLLTFRQRLLKAAPLGLGCWLLGTVAYGQAPLTVTVGTGTSAASSNALLSTSTTTNKYARTISIYTAAELLAAGAQAGSITKLYWFKAGAGEYTTNDAQLAIYLKRTTAATLPPTPVTWATEVSGTTQVYNGTMLSLPTGTGWKEFAFSAPFAWNGTDNIEVLVDWFRNSAPTADINWQYTNIGATSGLHATQVNSALSGLNTVRWAANRPNVQFVINVVSATRLADAPAGWVRVAPNPFAESLTVSLGAGAPGQALEATLTDALGRVQHQQALNGAGTERQLRLPAKLAGGVYFLTLRNEQWQQTLRLMH